jgi:hypothetical protein
LFVLHRMDISLTPPLATDITNAAVATHIEEWVSHYSFLHFCLSSEYILKSNFSHQLKTCPAPGYFDAVTSYCQLPSLGLGCGNRPFICPTDEGYYQIPGKACSSSFYLCFNYVVYETVTILNCICQNKLHFVAKKLNFFFSFALEVPFTIQKMGTVNRHRTFLVADLWTTD